MPCDCDPCEFVPPPASLPVLCVPVGVDVLPGADVPPVVPAWGLVPLPLVLVVPDGVSVWVSVDTPVDGLVCVPVSTPEDESVCVSVETPVEGSVCVSVETPVDVSVCVPDETPGAGASVCVPDETPGTFISPVIVVSVCVPDETPGAGASVCVPDETPGTFMSPVIVVSVCVPAETPFCKNDPDNALWSSALLYWISFVLCRALCTVNRACWLIGALVG